VSITQAERGPHRRARRAAAALAIQLCAAGAAGAATDRPPTAPDGGMARARFLMGTRLSIETPGPAPEGAFEEAFAEVSRLELILSNWIATSEISRLNEQAGRAPVRCSRDLFGALSAALRWAEATGGAFDPTVEPLTRALGLRDDGRAPRDPSARGVPEAPEARAESFPVGWRHVHLAPSSRSVRFDVPGVGIDLGGIGKGIALDAAARTLRSHGVRSALLDFGGQVLAIGRPPKEGAWTIGIADPHERDHAVSVIEVADLSIATSGNSERSVASPEGPIGHILDPRTRRPATFGGSVTVAARDATSADALSTALFVMGPERGAAWADAREIAAIYLWRDEDGVLRRRATRTFASRFGEGDDEHED
jgi:FAD:protein FMN transferase